MVRQAKPRPAEPVAPTQATGKRPWEFVLLTSPQIWRHADSPAGAPGTAGNHPPGPAKRSLPGRQPAASLGGIAVSRIGG